jgi:transcriptional regulator with PAS, ATPase and Fis domain
VPFVQVNCGAIPENLLEAELFGYQLGVFTDTKIDKKGVFELAEEGLSSPTKWVFYPWICKPRC